MPFDGVPGQFETDPREPRDLYVQRREDAAQLWLQVPFGLWDMRNFGAHPYKGCCALGWLARTEHDGWRFEDGFPVYGPYYDAQKHSIFSPDTADSFNCAAHYFGLTSRLAELCFGLDRGTAALHRRWHIWFVRSKDVVQSLRGYPVIRRRKLTPEPEIAEPAMVEVSQEAELV